MPVCRHGGPPVSEVFDNDVVAREDQGGHFQEEEVLCPESNHWEAEQEEEEKANKASPVAAITEKVLPTSSLSFLFPSKFYSPSYLTAFSVSRSIRRPAWSALCCPSAAR